MFRLSTPEGHAHRWTAIVFVREDEKVLFGDPSFSVPDVTDPLAAPFAHPRVILEA